MSQSRLSPTTEDADDGKLILSPCGTMISYVGVFGFMHFLDRWRKPVRALRLSFLVVLNTSAISLGFEVGTFVSCGRMGTLSELFSSIFLGHIVALITVEAVE